MTQNRRKLENSRRSFLKRSALTTGTITSGLLVLSGAGAACDEEGEGNYDEKSYARDWLIGDEFEDSICDGGSGTKISVGSTAIYWGSYYTGLEWKHSFSNDSYAEHYNEDTIPCEWEHGPGLENHRWSGRVEEEDVGIGVSNSPEAIGIYPEISGNPGEYTNTTYTGISNTLTYAFPPIAPLMTATDLLSAYRNDTANTSPPYPWEERQNWSYNTHKSCVSHHVRSDADGDDDSPTVHTESYFSNGFGFASVNTRMNVITPDERGSIEVDSTDEIGVEKLQKGQAVKKGDEIQLRNGQEAKIKSIKSNTGSRETMVEKTMSEEEFRRRNPSLYEEIGMPERSVWFPAKGRIVSITGRFI